MFGLDFQGQTIFFEAYIISKSVLIYSYIIYFKVFEFLELDDVKINTSTSVACIQPDNKSHLKVCLTLIFKVNCGDKLTYVSHFEIPNIGNVQIDTKNEYVCITYTTHDKQGVTISNSDLLFMVNGHSLKWRTQVKNCNYGEIRGIEHYEIDR